MDIEVSLISAIKTKEDFLFVLDEKITPDFFETKSSEFATLVSFYKKYGDVPPPEVLKEYHPNLEFVAAEQPIQFYVDRIKFMRKKAILKEALSEAINNVSKDPDAAETAMQKGVLKSKMEIRHSHDLDIREQTQARKERYLHKKSNYGVDGISTSWEFLDDKTAGLHPGDLIVTIAEPKMMKSWYLVWQSHYAWKVERVPVLLLTREMRPEAIQQRFDAIECGLPYDELRRGLLTPAQEQKYFDYIDQIKEDPVPYVILGYSLESSGASVSSIVPKVERYLMNGGLLCVDGIYLMEDDRGGRDWQEIVNITKDLKNLAQQYKIPILATSQAQIQGKGYVPNMENIAYGKYMAQYVDALLSISRDPQAKIADMSWMHLIAQREGDVGVFAVNAQFEPYCDFSQKHIVVAETDDDDDEPMKF